MGVPRTLHMSMYFLVLCSFGSSQSGRGGPSVGLTRSLLCVSVLVKQRLQYVLVSSSPNKDDDAGSEDFMERSAKSNQYGSNHGFHVVS